MMSSQSISLPFSIPDIYHHGFVEVHGIVRASEAGLSLEFETKLMGVFRSGVKEVQIPMDEIASVDVRSFWLATRLVIRTKSMAGLSHVPQSKTGKTVLWSMGRRNKETAARLVSVLRSSMAEQELNRLNQEIHQLDDPGV